MSDALPTPRSTLATGYVRVLVWCKACRHRADAETAAVTRVATRLISLSACAGSGAAKK